MSLCPQSNHPLCAAVAAIRATHPGLERLAVMVAVAARAKKCLLVVAPPGTGKSVVGEWLGGTHPNVIVRDSLTRSSLKQMESELSEFEGVMIFDDLGKIDTEYSCMQTVITMAELVYGHYAAKETFQQSVLVHDFHGAAVLNVQPNILASIVKQPSWHSNLADKTLRYYHLYRPTQTNRSVPTVALDWKTPFADVEESAETNPLWRVCYRQGRSQWTVARATEHVHDLSRAIAAFGGRAQVNDDDLRILQWLLEPCSVEGELLVKEGFGSNATLNANLLYLLVEFASYGNPTKAQIGEDYFMRPSQVQRVLSRMADYFYAPPKEAGRLYPTELILHLLEEAGV